MKIAWFAFLFSSALAVAAALSLYDKELANRLIGTWTTDPAESGRMVSTATYKSDGTGTELVRFRQRTEDTEVRIATRWSITNGILCLKCTGSSDPRRIPIGKELKDRIISISH